MPVVASRAINEAGVALSRAVRRASRDVGSNGVSLEGRHEAGAHVPGAGMLSMRSACGQPLQDATCLAALGLLAAAQSRHAEVGEEARVTCGLGY